MYGFILNHEITSTSLGLRLAGRVEIPTARRVVEDVEVAGRVGTLTRLLGWEDSEITLPLAIQGGPSAYRQAALAFMNASTISLTSDPGAYRRVKHAQVQPLRSELASWGFFDVVLTCEPFTYLDTGREIKTLTASGTINNPGLLEAAPIITVYGVGALWFSLDTTIYQVNAPTGQVTIDSHRLLTHVAGSVQIDGLTGPFPLLAPGDTQVALGPGIEKLEIQGNWRNP